MPNQADQERIDAVKHAQTKYAATRLKNPPEEDEEEARKKALDQAKSLVEPVSADTKLTTPMLKTLL